MVFLYQWHKVYVQEKQLHKLSVLRAKNRSAFSAYRRTETGLEVRELGNLASVSGSASITSPEGEKYINFIESWIKINDFWKLQFLTFDGEE
ncbi:hypothetical protein M1B34_14280 [Pseudomonas sp. MAFF 302030]|uniref:DUF4440 domain-containing protein n=1 Tax=Pseudomonas morbosilactucae TaxID=2938197 RepID=A0A9X1YVH7_9PSED|nr:hypothetical protein [Pseudomonas morbosilactucae]MCK9798855.1 hypothetical protein [Pseudomonas morbosilactucae]